MADSKLHITEISQQVIKPIVGKPDKLWYLGFALSSIAIIIGGFGLYNTLKYGIGTWGLDRTVGWGFAITNFVWWIGIGHAGTFISAILLLFRQKWRIAINRSAETMTILAILCAAIFPIIHMGRVPLFYYVFPYPNTRNVWVNFNSPLLWDVFAISTYFIVSLMFWYVGLIPDLAFLSNQKVNKLKKWFFEKFSLGWVGSARQWKNHGIISFLLASLATPLVISVHSIVSMDFATSIIPGWHSTIFPPYFVAGAIFSGFAMVISLLIIARKTLNLDRLITINHLENMNKIVLVTGVMVALAYFIENFHAFSSENQYEQFVFMNRLTGDYAIFYWIMLFINILIPQILWVKKLRRSIAFSFVIAILINIGMWLERFIIVVTSLHKDFIPANWTYYVPTFTEVAIFIGTFGFFLGGFLLTIRFLPLVSLSELKTNADE